MDALACTSCSKPFPSVQTLDRHRLRCRFRPRARKKACAECSRSKARCDQAVPACSRCMVHGLSCSYPQGRPETVGAPPPQPASTTSVTTLGCRDLALPLTPVSWTSSAGQDGLLVDTTSFLSTQGWIPDADLGWQFEALPAPDEGRSSADPVPNLTGSVSMALTHPAQQPSDPFQGLSIYLGSKWVSVEQGLDFMDRALKEQIDGFARGFRRPHFIHSTHWGVSGRPLALVEATIISQLYVTRTPHSEGFLLRAIDTQLNHLQRSLAKHDRSDDLATLQVAIVYAGMRIYRAGSTAAELIGRVPLRLMQHVLSRSLEYLTPMRNPTPEDWKPWIVGESIRRCFFILHALDYVAHTRQSLTNVFCGLYAEAPLPCPQHVWDAPTADEWAARYRAWEEDGRCRTPGSGSTGDGGSGGGGEGCEGEAPPLQARDMLRWVHGCTTGREEKLLAWFHAADEELARLAFECSRAQPWAEELETLL